MGWEKVKLGELLTESKVESVNPNPDRRITVRLNLKGVEKRPLEVGVEGGTKYYTRKAGQFIYGKQNLFKGAFGIIPNELDGYDSSSDIPTFDVNKKSSAEWVYYYLKQNNFYLTLESIATGTGSRRIQPSKLFEIEIPLPSLKEQSKLIEQLQETESKYSFLFSEIAKQKSYLPEFRQAILQDAVQGKLVPQNPKDEPASELLKKIKTEKAKLIAQGKLKKEKPLPPITAAEIPFELPKGWVWCRLGEICDKIGSGSTPRGGRDVYKNEGVKFIRSQNVYNEGLYFDNVAYIDKTTHSRMSGTKVIANDILINITGGSIGRCALVPNDFDEANVSQHVTIIRLTKGISNKFIHDFILSPYFQDKIMEVQTGGNREGLAKKNMELMLISIPPLSEQQRIVAKVEQLMTYCTELEQSISQSQKQAEQLLQAVLKEAFEQKQPKAVMSYK